ncbi:replication protein [Xenorhabdus griffiniae]|uniref:Replication protein n=1 Tax=Xenorhabdus griffiniae TaxID=351672 RepID=A0ABY9XM48_9GAMM|nr:replication protein [Xenorhabdus griffiniae]WMV74014.1 replication protein [Xenorhabdus griffiniae]WNH03694.1 replication protein [Xenorhabdus griffiniae]
MENQKQGHFALYRSLLSSGWAEDTAKLALWVRLLGLTQPKPRRVEFSGVYWDLEAGQLVTQIPLLARKLKDAKGNEKTPKQARDMLEFFSSEGMLTFKGNRHGTVITITNYTQYQGIFEVTNEVTNQVTNKPSDNAASERGQVTKLVTNQVKQSNKLLDTNVSNDRPRKSKSSGKVNPDAAVSSPKGDKWGTAEDLTAAEWIFRKVKTVRPNAKEPNWAAWANDIRLMRQLDNHTHADICHLFKWANKDSFWYCNILSPAKLREKWDTLEEQSTQANRRKATSESAGNWNNREEWEEEFI